MTGIVGAACGIGGFFLPSLLGYLKDQTDSFSGGFFAFAIVGMFSAIALYVVGRSWEGVFVGQGGKAVTPDAPLPEPTPGFAEMAAEPAKA